jgi:hypothetical protein
MILLGGVPEINACRDGARAQDSFVKIPTPPARDSDMLIMAVQCPVRVLVHDTLHGADADR